jgi:hypothetical protein
LEYLEKQKDCAIVLTASLQMGELSLRLAVHANNELAFRYASQPP